MLKSYLTYASTMEYDEEPDYKLLSKLFHTALNKIGCKDDVLDFSKAVSNNVFPTSFSHKCQVYTLYIF